MFQNFLRVIRISLGDFDFEGNIYLDEFETWVFWAIWIAIVLITCIIFLNFIIAEASASYEKVKENLKA